uniref:Sensory histidine kinase/phosphatase NtrB n=1 Tax=Candidatus Kentrum sp. SD TaxID=2126332 RepID=A0A451BPH3_9GAMM|nr:MAG: two-component system, NtrC family, nitrogen regulation sensor histidine kinase GlnL [Candidatus Kentron sp. SD]
MQIPAISPNQRPRVFFVIYSLGEFPNVMVIMSCTTNIPPANVHREYQIIDNLTTAVLLFDEESRLLAMNPAAEALLDISANKAWGLKADILFSSIDGCDSASMHVSRKQPFIKRETQLRLPGKSPIQVDCIVSPLNHPTQPGGVLMELIPLAHRQRVARAKKLLNQSETARMSMRRLAHEIRNPLGGLRGAAQLLARELRADRLREYTSVIIREADRLGNLIDRMPGPRTLPKKRRMNIHEVVERVRILVRAEAPPDISVERDYDPSIPDLYGDPDLLIQAVLNVARNAVQSLGDHGRVAFSTRVHRRFTIGHLCHRLVVRVDITDNGPGIPEELEETIFYPMVTGREEGGTGLGLPIAQSLVNRHGGLIECHGQPGATTFSILLPVAFDDESPCSGGNPS